ncbi:MAG: glutamine--tRNA ligase [Elusimicrobia bacterium CG1_02_63_36]|nr:MAG: glutamine--tRNA ligase [Elusimicrobia bacterium CG1_02_63_36]PIP84146.1 MAG: glutamine--tRNA ligase [Elusimicrobia bacterium CG22_combo_CG10-13_8_21_14_all_63_91]PJA16432.1 MAG: glutamine--tRNA ligase [Elusimicrobia bacterium CG_4_10_14_0_2_um_filter_63_34]PJB25692.1 MAG: glutamine--tRNA ligase [Elusimicrobia bacterium CG_4_9_14_3_um_filter_62_55]
MSPEAKEAKAESLDFVRRIVSDDLAAGKNEGKVVTRFPPEPNGYLHIGHAKSICLNFGIAAEFGGTYNLRFDDTNPAAEEVEYVDAIQEDIRWLGFDWGNRLFYASDYYERLYGFAVELIEKERAFVCDLSLDEIAARRGDTEVPGQNSPCRDRSVTENLDLFARMRAGEFPDGTKTLRAKIDMAHPNFHMRDPVLYRIKKVPHHRTGDAWVIYPMYDFAHPLSDALEGITHSICTLEFETHRPLYDWLIANVSVPARPRQIEFARLNLEGVLMSKRYMLRLVKEKKVSGWDDPRMPTLRAFRRRGVTPEAIRMLCEKVGVSKFNSLTENALLEHCIREDLNKRAPRFLGVMKPLKVTIMNYPEGKVEEFDAVNNPEDDRAGKRKVAFGREIFVEASDFMENPPKKFHRLAVGNEVRLRYAYLVTCREAVKNDRGKVIELRCTYDPDSRGGNSPDGRKVRGTIHWVSAEHAVKAEIRLYDRLFVSDDPAKELDKDLDELLNPDSLIVNREARVEPALEDFAPGVTFQFERTGYFCADPDSKPGAPVFNRTVALRDSWGKKQQNSP